MTPAEIKAYQLIEKFFEAVYKDGRTFSFEYTYPKHLERVQRGTKGFYSIERAIECALLHVDGILGEVTIEHSFEHLSHQLNNVHQTLTTPHGISEYTNAYRRFWLQVRNELLK